MSGMAKNLSASSQINRLCFSFRSLACMSCVLFFNFVNFPQLFGMIQLRSGAIIGDGDRKSWDARGPMIWDNFSIFRTNCAILTSYIRANPRTCRGFSRGCCHVAGSNAESC